MKTVLVTGANGQLGKCIQKIHKNYPEFSFYFKSSQQLDITNQERVSRYFAKNNIDYCINCAAYTNVELAETEQEKAYLVNAEAVKNLAIICKKSNTTLIHVSTDYVFDGTSIKPYTEEDTTNPISIYGASKRQGEIYIEEHLTTYFILRTSWLYSEFGKNFYKTILQKAAEKANLTITTEQTGTPTNANDLADSILEILTKNHTEYGIYNFSNEGKATWYDFAREIISNMKLSEEKQPVLQEIASYKTKAERPVYSVLNKTKIKRIKKDIPEWKASLKNLMLKHKIT